MEYFLGLCSTRQLVCLPLRGLCLLRSTAMWGMLSNCGDIGLSFELGCSCLMLWLPQSLLLCAEIWGPTVLRNSGTPLACTDDDLHNIENILMYQLDGGLNRSCSRQLQPWEFGCRPVLRAWLQSTCYARAIWTMELHCKHARGCPAVGGIDGRFTAASCKPLLVP